MKAETKTQLTRDDVKSFLGKIRHARKQNSEIVTSMARYRGAFENDASKLIARVRLYDDRCASVSDASLDLLNDFGESKVCRPDALLIFADTCREAESLNTWWDVIHGDLEMWWARVKAEMQQVQQSG